MIRGAGWSSNSAAPLPASTKQPQQVCVSHCQALGPTSSWHFSNPLGAFAERQSTKHVGKSKRELVNCAGVHAPQCLEALWCCDLWVHVRGRVVWCDMTTGPRLTRDLSTARRGAPALIHLVTCDVGHDWSAVRAMFYCSVRVQCVQT